MNTTENKRVALTTWGVDLEGPTGLWINDDTGGTEMRLTVERAEVSALDGVAADLMLHGTHEGARKLLLMHLSTRSAARLLALLKVGLGEKRWPAALADAANLTGQGAVKELKASDLLCVDAASIGGTY